MKLVLKNSKSKSMWALLLFEPWCQTHFYLPKWEYNKNSLEKTQQQSLFLLTRVIADEIAGWELKESLQNHKDRNGLSNKHMLGITFLEHSLCSVYSGEHEEVESDPACGARWCDETTQHKINQLAFTQSSLCSRHHSWHYGIYSNFQYTRN